MQLAPVGRDQIGGVDVGAAVPHRGGTSAGSSPSATASEMPKWSGSMWRPACAAARSIASRPARASSGVRKLPNQPSASVPIRRNAAGAEPPSQMSSGGSGRGATAAAVTEKY